MTTSTTNRNPRKRPGKPKSTARRPKAKTPALSNAELLQLAAKHRPPQSWYDEGVNPFEPKR